MMMKKLNLYLVMSMAFTTIAQQATKTMLRLPDTGQNTSYTNTFGEDNDYNINPPYFIDHGNGTVTDTITGLMWMKSDGGNLTFEQAFTYCDTLTAGGYNDWRLPDAHEAFSILNHQRTNPAIDLTIFSSTNAEYWWTATRQINDSNKVWVTNAGGGIGNHPKTEAIAAGGSKRFYARAVRSATNPSIIPNRYTIAKDGTISDTLTGLIWQAVTDIKTDTITWEDALNFASNYQTSNHKDWRLPNIKELQSINDEKHVSPSLTIGVFSSLDIKKFWSSTTLPNQITQAWYLDTQFGITTYALKTSKHSVLLVSGNIKTNTGQVELIHDAPSSEAFPNPFQEVLNIVNIKHDEAFEIRDIIGRECYYGTDSKINTQLWDVGNYWLYSGSNKPTKLMKVEGK